ncbi:MAG TPA: HAD family hydrolase [Vicinamibacterales bacterium]|jgi:D-glycero-D-manno-heptose 1,7-bisphosphate phosphatase
MKRAVFLDRDGTLNVDVGYLHRLEDLVLYPWTADALRLLQRAGYTLIVVTNQSGIAQGLIDPGFVTMCHDEMRRRLQLGAADLDALYYCPHHPRGSVPSLSIDCRCRKPLPGMVEDAVRDLGVDPSQSWVIGDKWLDVNLGRAVGAKSILVRTGWGAEQERKRSADQQVDAICDNLIHAVSVILHNG